MNPPLRSPVDAVACLAALADGTADAIATDHAPHTEVDKHVEFGWAINGISGIETALPVVLAAVGRGAACRSPARSRRSPPVRRGSSGSGRASRPGSARASRRISWSWTGRGTWTVTPETLLSRGKNSPLLGRELRGVVRLTIAGGRVAYSAD